MKYSPVILNSEIDDIFPEPFLPNTQHAMSFVSPNIYFYDINLKVKENINTQVEQILNFKRINNHNLCPLYIANGYHLIVGLATLFLPIKLKEIEKNTEKIQEVKNQEIFSKTYANIKYFQEPFDGYEIPDLNRFKALPVKYRMNTFIIVPYIVLKKNDDEIIEDIKYCNNYVFTVRRLIYKTSTPTDPGFIYYEYYYSTIPSYNYVDFITANSYSENQDFFLIVYSRSKKIYDYINISIRSLSESYEDDYYLANIDMQAGFAGFSKDLITKFVKIYGFRIFKQGLKDGTFFLMNAVPIDKTVPIRRNETFMENYIYNNFDSINTFVPKFTSNLSYLFQDSWTWIASDRSKHTLYPYFDYLNSSKYLLEPDKNVWKNYLENILKTEVSNIFKLILFEYWNKANPEIEKRKIILISILNNHENYTNNSDYLPQIESKFQPVQILLKSKTNRVPIFFYSEINFIWVNFDKIIETLKADLPKEKDPKKPNVQRIKPGEYSIKIISESIDENSDKQIQKIIWKGKQYSSDEYIKLANQIYIITVEDEELYKSVMMPDFIPIKKSVFLSERSHLMIFGNLDYKYKKFFYSTYHYLKDKAIEYYKNFNISILSNENNDRDKLDVIIRNLDNLTRNILEKFYLEYYEITPIIKYIIGLTIKINYDNDDNIIAEIKSIDPEPEIDFILYPRKSFNSQISNINERQKNYTEFITHKKEMIEPKYEIQLPSIFSQPEIKIIGLDKDNNFSFKLILGYKELTLQISKFGNLRIVEEKVYSPFTTLLKSYLNKKENRPNSFLDIWPFKWIDTKNSK